MINNRYKIRRKLGTGRSQVYLCTDLLNPSKDLAIKILSSAAQHKELDAFRNEYYLLKKIDHPNIVHAYNYGTVLVIDKNDPLDADIVEGSKFFTVDYIEGETLDRYEIGNEIELLHKILEQICSVLYYIHQSNYIYYDLKPENLIISNGNGTPKVFFYDFGLTKFIPQNEPFDVQGTPNYIAPEILQISHVDHRADFYSLGIMLYYLIYNSFPFETDDELKIYKANIEDDFEFPLKDGYENLIHITRILLNKSPNNRYKTSLQILEELQIPISEQMKNTWTPIKTFCGRKKEIYDINSNLFNKKANEIIAIRGEDGSGKTFFLEEIHHNQTNSILIEKSDLYSQNTFWNTLLRNVLYSEKIYNSIDDNLKSEIQELLNNVPDNLQEKLKSLFLRISRENNFLLLLDDFNSYDELSIELLKELIPILQVNGVKIILSEDIGKPILSDFINNLSVFNLYPFSEADLSEYFDKSYFKIFPKHLLKDFVSNNSDLLPGNIAWLIKNLIFLNILEYHYNEVIFSNRSNSLNTIENDQNGIYKLKLNQLSVEELSIVNLISLFNINIDINTISLLSGHNEQKIEKTISKLIYKGIFHNSNISNNPQFTSTGLKNFVYNNIPSCKKLHLHTAQKIKELIPNFNRIECARQFELAGNYKQCYIILREELESASAKSALTYQKKILSRLILFPLEDNDLLEVKYLLSGVLFQLGENYECLNLTDELLGLDLSDTRRMELLFQKGKCLIKLNRYKEGIILLQTILPALNNETEKQRVHIEIADAELDLGNYSFVNDVCRSVINEKQSSDETKAKAFSMLALVELKKDNNLPGAIYNFQYALNIYEKANLPYYVALMEMNIGNIISMKGNLVEAEKRWQQSFKINQLIGNLSHEANLLLNYGVFYYNTQLFEKAILQYQRAENIFSSLGNTFGRGLAQSNLGEVYLNICEYDLALTNLEQAKEIFNNIENREEEAEEMFLFGQCYFHLGETERLNTIIKNYTSSFEKNNLPIKHKSKIDYLNILFSFCKGDYKDVVDKITPAMMYYQNQDDHESRYYYAKNNALLIRTLIYQKDFSNALNYISDKQYLKICSSNLVLQAEKEFLLGLISGGSNQYKLEPEIDYYNKALQLIENQCILEITWEINYAIAKFYFERGNFKRFYEYSTVTKSLLNFIASKINSKPTRNKYLNSFRRKSVIETLEHCEKLI